MRWFTATILSLLLVGVIALAQDAPAPQTDPPAPEPGAATAMEDAPEEMPVEDATMHGVQDAPPAAPAGEMPGDATIAPPAEASSAAEPAPAESDGTEPTVTSTDRFTDWLLQCGIAPEADHEICVAFTQNGGETQEGLVVARLSLAAARATGDPIVILDLTRTAAEDKGVRLRVDRRPPWVAELRDCSETSCRLVVNGEQASRLSGEFRRGNRAEVTFLLGDGSPVTVLLSLMGFSAATAPILQAGR